MKTAMFVLAIIELASIFIGVCLHSVQIDLNEWDNSDTFTEIFLVSVCIWVGIALAILAIISKFI